MVASSRRGRTETAAPSPVITGGLLYVYDPGGGIHVYARAGKDVATLELEAATGTVRLSSTAVSRFRKATRTNIVTAAYSTSGDCPEKYERD